MLSVRISAFDPLPPSAIQSSCVAVFLFDQLVRAQQDRCRHIEAKRLGGRHIEHGLVFHRQLHRQIGRLLALKDAVDVGGRRRVNGLFGQAHMQQTAHASIVPSAVDCGQLVTGRKGDDRVAMPQRSCARLHHRSAIRGERLAKERLRCHGLDASVEWWARRQRCSLRCGGLGVRTQPLLLPRADRPAAALVPSTSHGAARIVIELRNKHTLTGKLCCFQIVLCAQAAISLAKAHDRTS